MKIWHIGLIVFVLIGGVAALKREPIVMAWFASKIEKTDLAERQSLLADAIEVRLPDDGAAPYPVVIQFHGCAGIREPFLHQWADVANEAGYAAMIVDSNGPRGYSREESLDIICNGKALLGQERAGDVYAAIKIAEADPRLDASRMVLAGWSHGALSIMDYFTQSPEKSALPGFRRAEGAAPSPQAAMLVYPYCGLGSLSRFRAPKLRPHILALIAGKDEVVDPQECVAHFEKRAKAGDSIDLVVYPDARHVFDDPYLEPEWLFLYNEDYANDAAKKFSTLLANQNRSARE